MLDPVVIIGIGEMGGVFARGFLRLGHPVYPVTRQSDIEQLATETPSPALVLLAVAEADLQASLSNLPAVWRDRLCLLQNELLPRDWQQHNLKPTVISVWFEKKPGIDAKVIVPSPIYGPHAVLLGNALDSLNIPSEILDSSERLLFELVRKNLYILASNICGLQVDGNVGELWWSYEPLVRQVAADILAIQEKLTGQSLDAEPLIAAMKVAFDGDLAHKCMGRSAPARLARALQQAEKFGVEVPALNKIATEQ